MPSANQNTAITIVLGPFINATDGTKMTSLTITPADVRLSKNGGAYAAKNNATNCSHLENGRYACPLSTTDTNTLGNLRIDCSITGALEVWEDVDVVANPFYAFKYGTTPVPAAVNSIDASVTESLVDLMWDEPRSGHVTDGTFGDTAEWANPTTPLDAAGTRTALGLATNNLDTQLGDIPNNTEFAARTKLTADYFDPTQDTVTLAATTHTGAVIPTVTDVTTKTGYSLSTAGVAAIWNALTSGLTTASSIGKLLVDNINATISSRLASASYTAPPTAVQVADQVWDEATSGHQTAGSTGKALTDAGSSGDPWSTAVPGAYGAGTAGYILGTNLNATMSSRSTLTEANVRTAVGLASANLDTQFSNAPNTHADALLKRDWTSVSGESPRSVLNALRFLRNKWAIVSEVLTVYKEDDTTTAWTGAVTGSGTADPVTSVDPN